MTASLAARVAGLTHRYGATVALDGLDFHVAAGAITGVIGPDGVGKSTLLGILAGVKRIQGGTVEVLGGDLHDRRHRDAVCARIAFMPQGLGGNLYGELSVAENIDFFGRLFAVRGAELARRRNRLMEATGLAPFADRRMHNLSGGMKQKLGLCCALVHDPDFLILDEPTTGVDPLSRRNFWRLVDAMRDERRTMSVLVATAYMEEAERFDALVMLDAGRVLTRGTPALLKARNQVPTLEEAYAALLPAVRDHEDRAAAPLPPARAADVPVIEAESLTRRFGDFTAVDHVDFRILRGEIFGFLGPNGSGKTTTMKMLTGLLPASEGVAKLFGAPVRAGALELRRRLGYMSQSFSLYSELTVRENLELQARLFDLAPGTMERRIAVVLDRFGLLDALDVHAHDLPLGMRQRLALAVAVIHEPEILILDEPTSGVDPVARDSFWRLIVEMARGAGVTVFVSTHYLGEAERCDRVALMNASRLLAAASPAELKRAAGADSLEEAFIRYIEADEAAGGRVAA